MVHSLGRGSDHVADERETTPRRDDGCTKLTGKNADIYGPFSPYEIVSGGFRAV